MLFSDRKRSREVVKLVKIGKTVNDTDGKSMQGRSGRSKRRLLQNAQKMGC